MMPVLCKRKLKDRPKTSCVYYQYGRKENRNEAGTRCSLTTYEECDPDACPWYTSEEMRTESYENARRIWARNHGKDNYYELGYGPKSRMNPRKNPDANKGGE